MMHPPKPPMTSVKAFLPEEDQMMDDGFRPASYASRNFMGSPMSWRPASYNTTLAPQDYPMHDSEGALNPASSTRHFLGSPMSWKASSLGTSSSGISTVNGRLNIPHMDSKRMDSFSAIESDDTQLLENNYSCCGRLLPDLHALLDHVEDSHAAQSPDACVDAHTKLYPLSDSFLPFGGLYLDNSANDVNDDKTRLNTVSPVAHLGPGTAMTSASTNALNATEKTATNIYCCPKKFSYTIPIHSLAVLHNSDPNLTPTEAEEAERLLRPFVCGVGNCMRRFKNRNGLRYHYRHNLNHTADRHSGSDQNVVSPLLVNANPLMAFAASVDLTGNIVNRSQYPEHGGSYADIYTGEYSHGGSNTKVAVKVLRAHIYREDDRDKLLKRLDREIRIWACLQHPNVLPLLGTVSSFGSSLSMVCPWMDEGDLAGYLDRNKDQISVNGRVYICEDITNGLHYIHSQGILHSDLTTANVLMDGGRAKLSDFGLSNVIAEFRGVSFMTSKLCGSARWAALELFSPDETAVSEPNFRTDIYSLGSVIFHVMSGEVPYAGLTETQVMLQVMKKVQPSRPPTLINQRCWELIKRCWSLDPTHRPSIGQIGLSLANAV